MSHEIDFLTNAFELLQDRLVAMYVVNAVLAFLLVIAIMRIFQLVY